MFLTMKYIKALQKEILMNNENNDFTIKDGVLHKYNGMARRVLILKGRGDRH